MEARNSGAHTTAWLASFALFVRWSAGFVRRTCQRDGHGASSGQQDLATNTSTNTGVRDVLGREAPAGVPLAVGPAEAQAQTHSAQPHRLLGFSF